MMQGHHGESHVVRCTRGPSTRGHRVSLPPSCSSFHPLFVFCCARAWGVAAWPRRSPSDKTPQMQQQQQQQQQQQEKQCS